MINQGNNVPDNTIAFFRHPELVRSIEIKDSISRPSKKRDWFDPHFYYCRPLVIGNQQGFVVHANFDFTLFWNGGKNAEDVTVKILENNQETQTPLILTNFGHGVVSFSYPFMLRTPPGINILTMAPPNEIMDNLTVLSGSVESDNLRHPFTFNIRINKPNIITYIGKGTPLSAFIPIKRYFSENFEIKMAEELFDESLIIEEDQVFLDSENRRIFTQQNNYEKLDKDYFKGIDLLGNKFPDFQKP
jgi:hypothetical protein